MSEWVAFTISGRAQRSPTRQGGVTCGESIFRFEKTRLRGQLNERQQKALLRMLRTQCGNYLSITGASPATATRDLADMMSKGPSVKLHT